MPAFPAILHVLLHGRGAAVPTHMLLRGIKQAAETGVSDSSYLAQGWQPSLLCVYFQMCTSQQHVPDSACHTYYTSRCEPLRRHAINGGLQTSGSSPHTHLALAIPTTPTSHASQDLTHATLVFKAYLAGASTQGSCAARLKGLLGEGCFHVDRGEVMIHSLAKVLVQTLKATLAHGADATLGDCVADIPAVLLSLASSYCKPNPDVPTMGAIFDATTNTNVPCTPVSTTHSEALRVRPGHWVSPTGCVTHTMMVALQAAPKLGTSTS